MTIPANRHPMIQTGRMGIRVDITLGMPKYDCRFHGICRLDVDENNGRRLAPPECGRVKGWLYIPHPEFCLICFDSETMLKSCLGFHFERSFFELRQDIVASRLLAEQLGSPLLLRRGQYRIRRKGTYYSVLFRIHC